MSKLPKKIRNLTDLQVCAKALRDPKLRTEAARRIIEASGYAAPVAKFYEPMLLAQMDQELNDPGIEVRVRAAHIVLGALEAEGLRPLETKPELGIERAREIVRDLKKELEDEEKSHPAN